MYEYKAFCNKGECELDVLEKIKENVPYSSERVNMICEQMQMNVKFSKEEKYTAHLQTQTT